MKKTLKFLALALLVGAVSVACSKDDDSPGDGDGSSDSGTGTIPGVTVDQMLSGPVKAGFADAIEITGSGFDPEQDWVYVGYEQDGSVVYERITNDVLTLRSGRISFGISINAAYLDKTFKVYLDRSATKMAVTNDLTITMPTVAEGYIPDPYFRATLMSTDPTEGNPEIAPLFNVYGLLDVNAAAMIDIGNKTNNYALNLYACKAQSLEGIELFKNIQGTVAAWGMPNIETVDFSNWTATENGFAAVFMNGNPKLKKFIGGPNGYRYDIYECPQLEYVDFSHSPWLYNVQLFFDSSDTGYSYVTYLDMRKDRSGVEMGGPDEGNEATWKGYPHAENEWVPYLAGAWFKVADNCRILVDYQYLVEKYGNKSESSFSGYGTIYSAWTRGATIEVYSSKDITKKLGTVPMYSDDNDALTESGPNNWVPDETE